MNNYSIAIYGSALRPNFDKYSDKDLLIVSESFETLNNLKEKYEKDAFSVSTYTYSKLMYLSKKGSLFVEHLKRESSILIDNNNKLNKILSSHKGSIPTNQQLKEAIEYFTLLDKAPNCEIGFAWFCDCFYVGLRNYLILKSARQNEYNFSFLKLIDELKNNDEVTELDYAALKELRVLKKNYRDKVYKEFPGKNYVLKMIGIANKLNLLKSVSLVEEDLFIASAKLALRDKQANHYHKLRLIEMYYYLLGSPIAKMDNIISNPQLYSLKFKDSKFIADLVEKMEESKTLTGLTKVTTAYEQNN